MDSLDKLPLLILVISISQNISSPLINYIDGSRTPPYLSKFIKIFQNGWLFILKMQITKLARKKLNQLFSISKKDEFEIRFRNLVLYDNILKTKGGVLCSIKMVKLICDRATEFGVEILGVETSLDSEQPFHLFVWEDYIEREQSPEWVMSAMKDYFEKNSASLLFFTINIPVDRIPELSKITGLTY